MINFPEDHLQYDEPEGFVPKCWNCNEDMYGTHSAFEMYGHWVCKDCFESLIDDEFTTVELAKALGYKTRRVSDMTREEFEYEF